MPRNNIMLTLLAAILIAASVLALGNTLASFAQSPKISVEMENDEYQTGDAIVLSGNIDIIRPNQTPLVLIFNPNGALYRADPVQLAPDGSYSYEFKVGGKAGITGTYRVVVSYAASQAETTFEFASIEPEVANVVIDGKSYQIRVRGGHFPDWLRSVSADPQSQSLVMQLGTVEEDKEFQMELDSSLIDTSAECFVVQVDGQEIIADCRPVDGDTTLLTFTVPEGSRELRIVGTFLAPEFGAVAGILLAATIGAIITATARSRGFGNNTAGVH